MAADAVEAEAAVDKSGLDDNVLVSQTVSSTSNYVFNSLEKLP